MECWSTGDALEKVLEPLEKVLGSSRESLRGSSREGRKLEVRLLAAPGQYELSRNFLRLPMSFLGLSKLSRNFLGLSNGIAWTLSVPRKNPSGPRVTPGNSTKQYVEVILS